MSADRAGDGVVVVFHADSLAGPMQAVKAVFEARQPGVTVNLFSGTSKQLASHITSGERCDVFASSSPAVIEQDLMAGRIEGSGRAGADWFVVFSANEMVVITPRGNPHGVRQVSDLAKPGLRFARVTGEKDLGTKRTIDFLHKAAAAEGNPDLAQKIVIGAAVDPAKNNSVPDTVRAVREGRADAGVVYYSAAVAAREDLKIIRFPPELNLSEAIRNAATVPGTAQNASMAMEFVNFLLSAEGRAVLVETGQPPVVPPIRKGAVPGEIR
jgi:molybdate transport system substrate-binding protein